MRIEVVGGFIVNLYFDMKVSSENVGFRWVLILTHSAWQKLLGELNMARLAEFRVLAEMTIDLRRKRLMVSLIICSLRISREIFQTDFYAFEEWVFLGKGHRVPAVRFQVANGEHPQWTGIFLFRQTVLAKNSALSESILLGEFFRDFFFNAFYGENENWCWTRCCVIFSTPDDTLMVGMMEDKCDRATRIRTFLKRKKTDLLYSVAPYWNLLLYLDFFSLIVK